MNITLADVPAEVIAQSLRTNAESELQITQSTLKDLEEKAKKDSEESVRLEQQAEKLKVKYDTIQAVADKAWHRLEALRVRAAAARNEWNGTLRTASNLSSSSRRAAHVIDQVRKEADALAEQLSVEAELNAQAEMLLSVAGEIDTSQPIEIETRGETTTCAWTTNDVYLYDGFGGRIPSSFGRYRVVVMRSHNVSNSITQVTAKCTLLTQSCTNDHHYPHPHISGDNCCLGNAQELLLAAMAKRDFVKVVVVMTEFLTTYNHANPYRTLRDSGIPNRWEFPVCETDQHLMKDCTCDRCGSCGRLKTSNTITYECGACSSCCVRYHLHEPLAEERKSGINGTGCTPRNAPRHLYRVQPINPGESHESNGQEDAHVHQDGVGQDVGNDAAVQG